MKQQITHYIQKHCPQEIQSLSPVSQALFLAGTFATLLLALASLGLGISYLIRGGTSLFQWKFLGTLLERTLGMLLASILIPCVMEWTRR